MVFWEFFQRIGNVFKSIGIFFTSIGTFVKGNENYFKVYIGFKVRSIT